jgi:phage shock protein PspC (stress-responsive transcriptional regulator)
MNQTKRKLHRSRNRIIGGVAAGLAEYFDIDPVLSRIVFVVLALINPPLAFIIYLLLMIFMPKNGAEHFAEDVENPGKNPSDFSKKNMVGMVFVLIGLFLLVQQFFPMRWFNWSILWPLIIIFVGFLILSKKVNAGN